MTDTLRHLTDRLVAAWRMPPWPLHRFAVMPRAYRSWYAAACPLSMLLTTTIWTLGWVPHAPIESSFVAMAAFVMLVNTTLLMRDSSFVGASTDLLVCLPLVFSGHTVEALACGIVFHTVMPLRKPVVLHLAVFNVVNVIAVLSLAAIAFDRMAGGSPALSGRGLVGGVFAYLCIQLYYVFTVTIPITLGRYTRLTAALAEQVSHTSWEIAIAVPLATLVSQAVDRGQPLYLAYLLVPSFVTLQALSIRDRLVDAKTLAATDPLTGLPNRRAMLEFLDDRLHEPSTADAITRDWLVYGDLDEFKRLNDTNGHDAGDEALRITASELEASVRERDLCARFGGEEFVVLVTDVGPGEIAAIAERIRTNIESRLGDRGTTISIGIHGLRHGDTADAAMAAADGAMYESKTSGKNRVTFSTPEQESAPATDADGMSGRDAA